jgi:hypothetical protein
LTCDAVANATSRVNPKTDTSNISRQDTAIEQQIQQLSEKEQTICAQLSRLVGQVDEESSAPTPPVHRQRDERHLPAARGGKGVERRT